jgi:hypothetical protein
MRKIQCRNPCFAHFQIWISCGRAMCSVHGCSRLRSIRLACSGGVTPPVFISSPWMRRPTRPAIPTQGAWGVARSSFQQASARGMARDWQKALEGLSCGRREVFVLRDIEELSTQETAETLGLTLPAVQARLHRARLQLRVTLGPILSCRQRSSELRVDDDLRIRVARAVYGHDHAKVCHYHQNIVRPGISAWDSGASYFLGLRCGFNSVSSVGSLAFCLAELRREFISAQMSHPTAVVVSTPTRIFAASIRHLQITGLSTMLGWQRSLQQTAFFTTEQGAVSRCARNHYSHSTKVMRSRMSRTPSVAAINDKTCSRLDFTVPRIVTTPLRILSPSPSSSWLRRSCFNCTRSIPSGTQLVFTTMSFFTT